MPVTPDPLPNTPPTAQGGTVTADPLPTPEPPGLQAPAGKVIADSARSDASGYWDWVNNKLNYKVLGFAQNRVNEDKQVQDKIIQDEVAHAHPWRAGLAKFYYGSIQDGANLAVEMSSVKNIGLNLLMKYKAIANAANLYFMYRGSQAVLADRAAKEESGLQKVWEATGVPTLAHGVVNDPEFYKKHPLLGDLFDTGANPDEAQSAMMGLSGVMMAGAGVGANATSTLHGRLQKSFGISGNLAAKVAAKISRAAEIQAKSVQEAEGVTEAMKPHRAALTDAARMNEQQTNLKASDEARAAKQKAIARRQEEQGITTYSKNKVSSINKEIPRRMEQILADAVQAVHQEKALVEKPFDDIGAELKGKPVLGVEDARATVVDALKAHGIKDAEIPRKVFASLEKPVLEGNSKIIDDTARGLGYKSYAEAIEKVGQETFNKYLPEDLRNLEPESGHVDFHGMTRLRNDLYDAAHSAKDGVLRTAFYDALSQVTKLQQEFAEQNGVGDRFTEAKQNYARFKRELGSGLMDDFISARDYSEQAIAPRLQKIMTSQDAEALRGLLSKAGVDVSPLDELIQQKKAFEQVQKSAPRRQAQVEKDLGNQLKDILQRRDAALKEIAKQHGGSIKDLDELEQGKVKEIRDRAQKEIEDLGKDNPVVPGRNDLDLAGMTNEELRAEVLHRLANNARSAGISSPYALAMVGIGLMRVMGGNMWGVLTGSLGAAKLANPELLRNPQFQNWLIREAGAEFEGPQAEGLREGMKSHLYPILQKIAKSARSGAAARTLTAEADKNRE